MLKPKTKRGQGRPKVVINWKKVDNFLKAQCTGTEIAGQFGISPITLYRAVREKFNVVFDVYAQQKKEAGKGILRAVQFKSAMDGNPTLQIFLGKQYLDQKDKSAAEVTGKDGKPLIPSIQIEIINSATQVKNDSGS